MGIKKQASSVSVAFVLPHLLLDRSADAGLGAQIARALREAIHGGRIKAGVRLPPSRDAARQLEVARNTILDAYDELFSEGLLEARGRLGSFVATTVKAARGPQNSKRLALQTPTSVAPALDWRLGQTGVQLLPLSVWRSACREAGRHLPPGDYGDPRGVLGLREAIADWLRRERGVSFDAQQIVVTQGAGAAVDLAVKHLVRPGDRCVVEVPGYTTAKLAMQRAGAKVVGVPVDEEGIDVMRAFAQPPRLLHLTPSHQYPMGARLSGARRQALVQLMVRHGSYLIENEYDHEFIFEGQNHTPLCASIPERTVLISTFAKAISPALRVGFVAAPLAVADAIARDIEQSRQHVSWPVQMSLQWMLRSGELQRHLRRIRRHYAALRRQLLDEISSVCPGISVRGEKGGLHLVLTTGSAPQDKLLSNRLRARGIALNTLRDFGGSRETPLMGYGHMNAPDIAAASASLALALRKPSLRRQFPVFDQRVPERCFFLNESRQRGPV
jgi:GntR family transcriptional regulator / MocR family aminotransferase